MRQFAYSLDSSPTGIHVVYALIQLYTVQQEVRHHYRYSSRMNSRMSILTVTIAKNAEGELSKQLSSR